MSHNIALCGAFSPPGNVTSSSFNTASTLLGSSCPSPPPPPPGPPPPTTNVTYLWSVTFGGLALSALADPALNGTVRAAFAQVALALAGGPTSGSAVTITAVLPSSVTIACTVTLPSPAAGAAFVAAVAQQAGTLFAGSAALSGYGPFSASTPKLVGSGAAFQPPLSAQATTGTAAPSSGLPPDMLAGAIGGAVGGAALLAVAATVAFLLLARRRRGQSAGDADGGGIGPSWWRPRGIVDVALECAPGDSTGFYNVGVRSLRVSSARQSASGSEHAGGPGTGDSGAGAESEAGIVGNGNRHAKRSRSEARSSSNRRQEAPAGPPGPEPAVLQQPDSWACDHHGVARHDVYVRCDPLARARRAFFLSSSRFFPDAPTLEILCEFPLTTTSPLAWIRTAFLLSFVARLHSEPARRQLPGLV